MKILPKYMLFLPQEANIQSKLSSKTKPNQKDWQKLSFPTPVMKIPTKSTKLSKT